MINTHEVLMSISNNLEKESIICSLCEIASFDDDFNGNNGDDYLWEVAKENGYKSNMDYLADNIQSTEIADIISEFFIRWIESDTYYDSYDFNFVITDDKKVIITFSYVIEN